MENEIRIFNNNNFGEVRTTTIGNKAYFVANDIAKALGYSSPKDAISRHCKGGVETLLPSNGGTQKMKVITEGDIYRLVIKSKLPQAEKFESWIFDEVLPTIRKTGGYVDNDDMFVNTYLPFADEQTKLLFKSTLETVRIQNGIISKQQNQLDEQKPMVQFVNNITESSDSIDVGQFAKLIKDEGIKLGRNKLFDWLRDNEYLRKNNEPYQRYIDNKVFETKEFTYKTPYGIKIGFKTLISGKGQIYLMEKLRKEFN